MQSNGSAVDNKIGKLQGAKTESKMSLNGSSDLLYYRISSISDPTSVLHLF
jgi:hypothetical protein